MAVQQSSAAKQAAFTSVPSRTGLLHVENPLYLDVAAQVLELSSLCPEAFDQRLGIGRLGAT